MTILQMLDFNPRALLSIPVGLLAGFCFTTHTRLRALEARIAAMDADEARLGRENGR